jgi:hypothetical protein
MLLFLWLCYVILFIPTSEWNGRFILLSTSLVCIHSKFVNLVGFFQTLSEHFFLDIFLWWKIGILPQRECRLSICLFLKEKEKGLLLKLPFIYEFPLNPLVMLICNILFEGSLCRFGVPYAWNYDYGFFIYLLGCSLHLPFKEILCRVMI